MIVGISGYARSGKSTVAKMLEEDFKFKQYAFADALREEVLIIDPLLPREHALGTVRLSSLVNEWGWEEAKKNPEVRRLLQVCGTEAGRDFFGQDCWVKRLEQKIMQERPGTHVVVSDVRFPNEADWIINLKGRIIRVVRKGTKPVNAHVSETALDPYVGSFDWLSNEGSLEALRQNLKELVALWPVL